MGDWLGDAGAILNSPFRAGAAAFDALGTIAANIAVFIRYMIYVIIVVVVVIVLFYIIKSLIDVRARLRLKPAEAVAAAKSDAPILQTIVSEPMKATVPVVIGAGKSVVDTTLSAGKTAGGMVAGAAGKIAGAVV